MSKSLQTIVDEPAARGWVLTHKDPARAVDVAPEDGVVVSGAGNDVYFWRNGANFGYTQGHQNAVLATRFTKEKGYVVSCSADKSVILWDQAQMKRIHRHEGHTGIVNDVCSAFTGPGYISGGDDGLINVWDPRSKGMALNFESKYEVLAVVAGPDAIYSAGVDGSVSAWDLRKPEQPAQMLYSHANTITGLDFRDGRVGSVAMDGVIMVYTPPLAQIEPDQKHAGRKSEWRYHGVEYGPDMSLQRVSLRSASPQGDHIYAASLNGVLEVKNGAVTRLASHSDHHTGPVVDVRYSNGVIASASLDKTVVVSHVDT